ncbi:high-affinity Cu transporter [Martiniozyma asiatica (nom. inval.)]|nr:high-affinity Cu transporter [Martiniozyma asiatica]
MPEYTIPFELQNKMDMDMGSSSTSAHTCKVSMLWNWYTIDACFISKSWHVKSSHMFAGTCIGVFFWVLAYCWYHRCIVEFDRNVAEFKQVKVDRFDSGCCCDDTEVEKTFDVDSSDSAPPKPGSNFWGPLIATLSHKWFLGWKNKKESSIYPSPLEHIARSSFYMVEWTCSYLIMLMWMYYNGYIIITMILAYFFGQLIFNYAPIAVVPKKELSEFPIRP